MKGLASALLVWGLLFGGFAEATTTTLNPADKAVNATLSNGNLTITTTPSAYSSARSTTAHTAGKWYFEITVNSVGGTTAQSWGLANSTESLANVPGADSNGTGYSIFDSSFRAQGAQAVESLGTITTGSVIGVAVDFTNMNAWIIGPSGVWNGVATSDPATNTKGMSCLSGCLFPNYLSGLLNGQNIFAMVSTYNSSRATANFGGSAFSRTIPVGFQSWDGAQGSTVCTAAAVSAGPC